MKYKIMRVLCMFDLPVETEKERRSYRIFRKALMKEGFVMMQYSVYVRVCPSREYANRLEKRVAKIVPPKGNVRLLCVTEKQYEDMKLLVGSKSGRKYFSIISISSKADILRCINLSKQSLLVEYLKELLQEEDLEEKDNFELVTIFLNLLERVLKKIPRKQLILFENSDHLLSQKEYEML